MSRKTSKATANRNKHPFGADAVASLAPLVAPPPQRLIATYGQVSSTWKPGQVVFSMVVREADQNRANGKLADLDMSPADARRLAGDLLRQAAEVDAAAGAAAPPVLDRMSDSRKAGCSVTLPPWALDTTKLLHWTQDGVRFSSIDTTAPVAAWLLDELTKLYAAYPAVAAEARAVAAKLAGAEKAEVAE